ncbi:hypothetical protein ABPG73_000963 [Tetrahymena malaccensis]
MSQNILEQYLIIRSINGGYQLEHKKTKEQAIYKNIISHIHYDDQKQLIERRTSIKSCSQLQKIINCQISQYKFENNNQFLSNISIIYEDIALRFDNEINNRIKQKIYWTEEEILNTLESAVQALCVLHEHHLVHGDIRPSSIACDLTGEVKLLDQFATSNHFFKNLQQVVQSGGYLTPELCKCYQMDNQEYVLESRNDVFSLGLVFLEATTLTSSLDIQKNIQINEELLKTRLDMVKKLGYSQRIVNILSNMLLIDGDLRPSIQYIQQIGWGNSESSKLFQLQEISSIPIIEGESISHSIILKKVLGDQSIQNSDFSKKMDCQQLNWQLKELQQASQNQSNWQFNDSKQKFNKILDSQDTSLNMTAQISQNTLKNRQEDFQNKDSNNQTPIVNQENGSQQKQNYNYQSIPQKHQRCKTECQDIKVFTKNSQKSFSKVCEDPDETNQFKDNDTTQISKKKDQSILTTQKKYSDLSQNEQYENICPQCVRKMVSPLLRNAFSPRLEAIQDEESIRKSLIKQTPLLRISKCKKELESCEPINYNNFNFQLDKFCKNKMPTYQGVIGPQSNYRPPLHNQSQAQLSRVQLNPQRSQQSFHQTSINSNWNQSINNYASSTHQTSQNDSFTKNQTKNPLKNIQGNQLLNRSYSRLEQNKLDQFTRKTNENEYESNQLSGCASLPGFQMQNSQQKHSSYNSHVQRKPLFGNNQNMIPQKQQYFNNRPIQN